MHNDNDYLYALGIAPDLDMTETVPLAVHQELLANYDRMMEECREERTRLRARNYRTPYVRVCWMLLVAAVLLILSWAPTAADAFMRWWK